MRRIGYVIVFAMLVFGGIYLNETFSNEQNLMEKYNLADKNIYELVYALENNEFDRSLISSSIENDKVKITIEEELFEYNLPNDEMYISIAPYIETTHDCFSHSLTGCQGELINQEIQIVILDELGLIISDELYFSGKDGFIGIWLPKDEIYEFKIYYQALETSMQISTRNELKTCYTEGELS